MEDKQKEKGEETRYVNKNLGGWIYVMKCDDLEVKKAESIRGSIG